MFSFNRILFNDSCNKISEHYHNGEKLLSKAFQVFVSPAEGQCLMAMKWTVAVWPHSVMHIDVPTFP